MGKIPPCAQIQHGPSDIALRYGQDETFTTNDDSDVNLKCPKEYLRKRQYTMHLVFNCGVGEKGHGWCDLVCRGKGMRISAGEKALWDDNVKVWVDKHVMKDLAIRFVDHKKKVGEF